MYTPKHFQGASDKNIIQILNKYSFATIISSIAGDIFASKIPLHLHLCGNDLKKSYFFGHFAKKNPQANFIRSAENIIAIFDGAHHYISPAWYPIKSVPTWDYVSIQIKGKIEIIEDETLCLNYLDKMIQFYEKMYNTNFSLNEINTDNLLPNLGGIVCFKLSISDIQSSFKLSQNKSEETIRSVLKGLGSLHSDLANDTAILIRDFYRSQKNSTV